MAESCSYTNAHGVKCSLKPNHPGDHEPTTQLVPPDPFCLQPWDPFTLAAIRLWISAAHAHRVSTEKIQRAEEHFSEIARWQKSHGTKLPG